ncbi:hypothetical protein ACSBR2_032993 [Camellia fascicularis]
MASSKSEEQGKGDLPYSWGIEFLFTIWTIWKDINNFVFRQDKGNDEPSQHFQHRALLEDTKFLMKRCNCIIAHILREGNKSIDGVANIDVNHQDSFVFFNDPSSEIVNLLVADIIGLSFVC